MKPITDSPLAFGWRTWAFGPGREGEPEDRRLIVTVKATLELPREGTCALAAEQAPVTGDLFWDDDVERTLRYASDAALVKPRGEVWLSGTLRSREPVTELACRARVGPVEARFSVLGDRWWEPDGAMSAPEPFTAMELSWERCFGGPGNTHNPVGRGLTADPTDGAGRVPLPNIERYGRLIRSAAERPEPAGAWPIPPTWPERASRLGTYDGAYARTRWPYLADDFSWSHFQAAPESQRIDGYWRGDEPVELDHLHPAHARLRCRLPGIKPRVFLHEREQARGPLREVGLVLDTIAIDPGEGRAFLVWRGSTPCLGESLHEFEHLYLTHEPLGQARSEAEYLDAFVARLRALWEEEQAFEVERPEPPAAPSPEPARVAEPATAPSAEELHAELHAAQRESALKQGWPEPIVDDLYPREPRSAAPIDPTATREQLERALAAAEELELQDLVASLRFMLESAQGPEEAVEERAPEGGDAPPAGLWTSQEHRDRVRRGVGRGESLAGLALVGADLALLDLSGQDLSGARLTGADLRGANLARANLAGATLDEAKLEGAVLTEANLTGASLALVEASGVDFRGANLTEAVFERATLAGAIFTGVIARAVAIEECLATGTNFDGAQLEEAELARSNFDEASFRGASMVDARLEGSSLRCACLDQVSAPGLRASDGADLSEARIRWARLAGASFSTSLLIGAHLTESDLTRASFAGAGLEGAELLAVRARAASFAEARLMGATLAGADLLGARFEGADLRLADLSAANLFQAEFWRAALTDMECVGANVEGTKLA